MKLTILAILAVFTVVFTASLSVMADETPGAVPADSSRPAAEAPIAPSQVPAKKQHFAKKHNKKHKKHKKKH